MVILSQLENAEYLHRLYWDYDYSLKGIASECNASERTVSRRMKYYGIPRRNKREASYFKERYSGKESLISFEDLYDLYRNKLLTIQNIANQIGVSYSTVRYWLETSGIGTRSSEETQYLLYTRSGYLSLEALEWMEGELLGDGCIRSPNKSSGTFYYGSKYEEYINYVSRTLAEYGIEQGGNVSVRNIPNKAYYYHSKAYAFLKELHNKWYCDRVKKVPRNLELTPLVCRQWYIGDGSLQIDRGRLVFYTNGFEENCVDFLVDKLSQIGFHATKVMYQSSKNQKIVRINKRSTSDFLNYIGPCPVECYQYKWDLSRVKKGKKEKEAELC